MFQANYGAASERGYAASCIRISENSPSTNLGE
jgi:hypothetical protein